MCAKIEEPETKRRGTAVAGDGAQNLPNTPRTFLSRFCRTILSPAVRPSPRRRHTITRDGEWKRFKTPQVEEARERSIVFHSALFTLRTQRSAGLDHVARSRLPPPRALPARVAPRAPPPLLAAAAAGGPAGHAVRGAAAGAARRGRGAEAAAAGRAPRGDRLRGAPRRVHGGRGGAHPR